MILPICCHLLFSCYHFFCFLGLSARATAHGGGDILRGGRGRGSGRRSPRAHVYVAGNYRPRARARARAGKRGREAARTGRSLEALQAEGVRLQRLDASRGADRREPPRDRVHAAGPMPMRKRRRTFARICSGDGTCAVTRRRGPEQERIVMRVCMKSFPVSCKIRLISDSGRWCDACGKLTQGGASR